MRFNQKVKISGANMFIYKVEVIFGAKLLKCNNVTNQLNKCMVEMLYNCMQQHTEHAATIKRPCKCNILKTVALNAQCIKVLGKLQ